MHALSAAEAISPAVQRTKALLFHPFRWGTFLKLCAVAVFTEGFSGNFNSHNKGASAHVNPSLTPFHLEPMWIAAAIAMCLLCILVLFALFYLAVRLRFALFHCLAHQTTLIRPGWHFYREPSLRFFVFSIVVGLVYLIVAIASLLPFLFKLFHLLQENQGGSPSLPDVLSLILPLIPLIVLLIFGGIVIDIILRDFMLPHFALENASVAEAWDSFVSRFAADKGAFLFYGVLRILLPFGAMILLLIVLAIPMVILFGIPGLMIAGLQATITQSSGPVVAVAVFLQVILGLLMAALGLFIAICFGGPLSIAVRNYALVFYGGRYPVLGAILYPPPPAPLPANPIPA